MTHTDIVRKLIGPIKPLGDSNRDDERLENVKSMCKLLNELYQDVVDIAHDYDNDTQASVVKIVHYIKEELRMPIEE